MRKLAGLIVIAAALALAAAASAADSKEELRKTIQDNPDIVLDFLRDHKVELFDIVDSGIKAKREDEKVKRRAAELARPLTPAIDPARIVMGKPDAPATVVEYSDFLCSFCARGARIIDELVAAHPDGVRVIYKHMPSSETSKQAALYYEAILMQNRDKARKFHDLAFAGQEEIFKNKEDALKRMAAEAKADTQRLAADIKRKELTERLLADDKEAREFDFQGTPSYVVNGVSIRGAQPLSDFEEIIKLTAGKR
ncbi:MAG: thioredoxin domain-containing protein [Desulfovibrionaceae bacterium]|nr:thioredoxin domain-containing protein [Desulfovibrionaceae bacterium]MBF0513565.1 thioredoxin domain-containing protein [Desulfovibrionaceae bacterium]